MQSYFDFLKLIELIKVKQLPDQIIKRNNFQSYLILFDIKLIEIINIIKSNHTRARIPISSSF